MKKILTITTATLALWAVSTFIVSNQTQKEFENYINKSNKLYETNGLKLTLSDYQKSFLNSKATMEIDVLNPEVAKKLKEDYILPIKVQYDIEHGPLLFKNGFGLGLSKIHNELLISSMLQPKAKEEFLKLVKDDIKLKTNMVISFAQNLQYKIESDAVHINQDKKDFTMTPLSVEGTSNIKTLTGEGKVAIAQIELKEENSSNALHIDNLAMDIKIDEIAENNIVFGDFLFSVKNLLITDDNNPEFNRVNIALNGLMQNKRATETTMDSNFQANINLKDTKLPTEFKELQNVKISMNMKELGIKGMSEFQKIAQEAQQEQTKLLTQLLSSKQEEMQPILEDLTKIQDKMVTKIIHSLNNLLVKDKTSIAYALDIETKDKASTKALAEVGYTGDIEFKGTVQELAKTLQSQILSLIRLKVDIELNKKHLKLLPIPMLEQQLQMGVAQGFVKETNSSFSLNGYYKEKQLIVNDNNLTATVLPLLMMMTAQ